MQGPPVHPSPADAAPTSTRRPRVDLFGGIHKAIRCSLSQALVRMGQASFEDEADRAAVLDELGDLLAHCELHAEHEERFIRPACEGRLRLEAFDAGHPAQARFVAELRSLASALSSAPEGRRAEAGRALYLHFAAFAGETLLHMTEEEQLLLPLLHRALSDDEMQAIHARIVGSMSRDELARSARRMLPAVDREERLSLLGALLAHAPRQAVRALVESAGPALPAGALGELLARVG